MAVNQGNTKNEGLYFDDGEIGVYSGPKDELLATGKFKPEWFPGVKGNKNNMTIEGKELRTIWTDPSIVKLEISRDEDAHGRKLFYVGVFFTEEETARRKQMQAQEFRELAYKEASALAKGWVDDLPDSVESFKNKSARRLARQIEIHEEYLSRGGYSFDKETMRNFDHAVMLLCNTLTNGKVRYDQFFQDQQRRDYAADAFNRGICLSLTGHERDVLIQRFMREFVVSEAEAVPA